MKKEYITPEIEILELLAEKNLLESSGPETNPDAPGVEDFD